MNSKHSSSDNRSSAFSLLDERIQRWIWNAGWTELRDIQESAIPVLVDGRQDVIISAATASGKTEAAFFPILTSLLTAPPKGGSLAVYVSPLKALINDQWSRLELLCQELEIQVTPWHGDISAGQKKQFIKKPAGCLLITPESLEGILIRYGSSLATLFGSLRYFVIDELHAFIDTERGKQLQSQMGRIEVALNRRFTRVGLSATLGEMGLAAEYLRPEGADSVKIITSQEEGPELKLLVKGYYNKQIPETGGADKNGRPPLDVRDSEGQSANREIARDLFTALRGHNNLIFPNSRARVEEFADLLRQFCEDKGIPNEFWPHHGSLSKDIREKTEEALKSGERPATAIATSTLELGIDIGAVKSVAQIGPAPSVAALRQRLGRSGRRKDEAAILRCFCLEDEIVPDSPVSDLLREGLIQTIAQIRLMLQGWFEPPRTLDLHASTLIQQLLSLIAQYGGVSAQKAWKLLCQTGVFPGLSQREFSIFLRSLGQNGILTQEKDGLLLLGPKGERIVNHFSFLAAFATPEEFRVLFGRTQLGTLPLSRPINAESYLIFAGKRWQVLSCREEDRIIEVAPAKGGKLPVFEGMGVKVHDRVRAEMRKILASDERIAFLDRTAAIQLTEARNNFLRLELSKNRFIEDGKNVLLLTWLGDWTNDAIALLLSKYGVKAGNEGLVISCQGSHLEDVQGALKNIERLPPPVPGWLAENVENKTREKWDYLVPDQILDRGYELRDLDIEAALQYVKRSLKEPVNH